MLLKDGKNYTVVLLYYIYFYAAENKYSMVKEFVFTVVIFCLMGYSGHWYMNLSHCDLQ